MTESKKRLRFAIIGCGRIAQRYAEHIQHIGELVAACDIKMEKAQALTDNCGATPFTELQEMLESPRLNTQAINTKELNRPFTFKQIVRRACRRALNAFLGLFSSVVTRIPYFHFLKGTQGSQNPCLFRYWFWQTFLGLNRTAY